MQLIKVAAAALNQTPLDWAGNVRHIVGAIRAARAEGVAVLCLPELCITGYGCEDMFHARFVQQTAWARLREIAPETAGLCVAVGLPVAHRNALYDAVAVVADGEILGLAAKRYLARDGIHYEARWFRAWPVGRQETFRAPDGFECPIGDLIFEVGGVSIGFEICEEAWVAERPGMHLAARAVDLILNPSASHFAFGKIEARRRFVLEGARAFRATYVYANLVGNEAGRAIYDGAALIAPPNRPLVEGPRFSFRDWVVTAAVVDLDLGRMAQSQAAQSQLAERADGTRTVRAACAFPAGAAVPAARPAPAWERSPDLPREEFARAEALGLFDYLRKSRSHAFVLSLSGGADSSSIAALVRIMAQTAVAELGLAGVREKFGYSPRLRDAADPEALGRQLLLCVYQRSRQSSATTLDAARAVAAAVGAEFLDVDIDPIVESYTSLVAGVLGRPLSWQTDDLALQNIQARVRGPSVWMLANIRGALLLSTSNKSEAAVGYATMDGDTCGGLCPLGGIGKAFLREWLRWMETDGPHGVGPIPALRAVNVQSPTAELRPQTYAQTDEADLMPYPVLDACERAAIRDKQPPAEVLRAVAGEFPQHDSAQLVVWVERFFRLWTRNQWKRERYAPCFHLDETNLDPKTWCRFPILSGGFTHELQALAAT
jgi:NAD+ synthase (glutamine-hydrolysing)